MCWAPVGASQTRSGCGEGSSSARRRASSGSAAAGASTSAANARAARRVREAGGPRKRYACEGSPASAALSATRARAWCSVASSSASDFDPTRVWSVSAALTHRLHHALVHFLDRAGRVDHHGPVAGDLGDLLVGGRDCLLQADALLLEAVVARGAAEAGLGIEPQQQGEVRPEAVGGGIAE